MENFSKNPPRELILDDKKIKELEKEGIIYFNCPQNATLEEIAQSESEKEFNKQNYVLVGNNLYVQGHGQGIRYVLKEKGFSQYKNH